jgi:MFS family permease
LSFSAANLPLYAHGDTQLIIFTLLAFGIAASVASFVCGKLFDRFGMRPLLAMHVITVIIQCFLLICTISTMGLPDVIFLKPYLPPWFNVFAIITVGASFGFLDFLMNTVINVSISQYYHRSTMPAAFSFYRFASCSGFGLCALISASVSDLYIIIAHIIFCLVSVISYLFFERLVVAQEVCYYFIKSL